MSIPTSTCTRRRCVETRPGAVLLSRSAFHPGGGGQVSDIGAIEWAGGTSAVTGVEVDGERWWHLLADDATPEGDVEVRVDAEHRRRVASLHTASHVLNAFVFAEFAGALVTGAQINGDGTGRMDFDLPEVDNDRVRALADPVNDDHRPRRRRHRRLCRRRRRGDDRRASCAACRLLLPRPPMARCG